MGSLLAIVSEPGDPELPDRLERMVQRSSHRGEVLRWIGDGVGLATQNFGTDGSIAELDGKIAGFYGFVGNWGELETKYRLDFDGRASHAARLLLGLKIVGWKILSQLRGEYSFVVVDPKAGVVAVARDPVGCKPLFIHRDKGRIYLATEIRQALAGSGAQHVIDENTVVALLTQRRSMGESTLFRNVDYVLPGETYEISVHAADTKAAIRSRFWDLPGEIDPTRQSDQGWLEGLGFYLQRAIMRSMPEGRFAVTLSGGLDSSSVWAEMDRQYRAGQIEPAECVPISLVFPGQECDESEFIEKTINATFGSWIRVDATRRKCSEYLQPLLGILDSIPFPTTYQMYLVAEKASQCSREVVLTGHLGDHWFDVPVDKGWSGSLKAALFSAMDSVVGRGSAAGLWQGLRRLRGFDPWWLNPNFELSLPFVPPSSRGDSSPAAVIAKRLDLVRGDWGFPGREAIGAHFGVEFRHPFSDLDLVAHAASMPETFCGRDPYKPALRRHLDAGGIIPEKVVWRSDKTVFDLLFRDAREVFADFTPIRAWTLVRKGLISGDALDRKLESQDNESWVSGELYWLLSAEAFAQNVRPSRLNRMGARENGKKR